jgi:hypothetical protein
VSSVVMTVQPPRSFGPALLAAAEAAGAALLAIKACAHGKYEAGAERKYEACWYLPEEDPAFVETPPRGSDPQKLLLGPKKYSLSRFYFTYTDSLYKIFLGTR